MTVDDSILRPDIRVIARLQNELDDLRDRIAVLEAERAPAVAPTIIDTTVPTTRPPRTAPPQTAASVECRTQGGRQNGWQLTRR